MRARNVKPGLFMNDDLAELSFEARYFFIGLWLAADREGYLDYKPKRLKAEILPYDSSNVEKLLEQLCNAQFIQILYKTTTESCQERVFIHIPNFVKHQNPHKNEKPSEIALLVDSLEITGVAPELYCTNPAERGKRKEERGKRNTAVEELTRQADYVIDYLNERTKKQFRHSQTSREPIIARLRDDKATVEECELIINNKIADPDFDQKYLQPSTLFRKSNFENYLNHKITLAAGGNHRTCDKCLSFCSPGSPDKCNKRGNMGACDDYTECASA